MKTFILYTDWNSAVQALSDSQAGQVFKGLFSYAEGREPTLTDPISNFYLKNVIIPMLTKNAERYEEVCVKRREAGRRGGEASATKSKQMLPNASNCQQVLPNASNCYINNKNDNDNDNDNENKNTSLRVRADTRAHEAAPTLEEVKDYCDSNLLPIDAERFWNYYQARGWQAGKVPLHDWQAEARNWAAREGTFQQRPQTAHEKQMQNKAQYMGEAAEAIKDLLLERENQAEGGMLF